MIDINNFWGWLFIITAAIVVIQLIMSIINGTDLDLDLDGDGVADFDLGTLVSPKGILHFLFGGSGYLTLVGPHGWTVWGYLLAIVVGLVVAAVLFLVYYGMSKLADEKRQEEGNELVGRSGVVYLPLNFGTYEISVVRNGRNQTLTVISKSRREDYKTGTSVTIVSFEDGNYYIE